MLTPSHLTIHSLLRSCAKTHLRVDSESDNKLNSTLTPCSLVHVPTNLRIVFSKKIFEIQFSLIFLNIIPNIMEKVKIENYQIFRIVLRSLDCSLACTEFSIYHLPSMVSRMKNVSLGYLGGIAAKQRFE